MARKKNETPTEQIQFRCPVDIAAGLKTLVFINSYENLSALLVEMCGKLVSANRRQIANVNQSRARNKMCEATYEIASSTCKTAALKGGDADEKD